MFRIDWFFRGEDLVLIGFRSGVFYVVGVFYGFYIGVFLGAGILFFEVVFFRYLGSSVWLRRRRKLLGDFYDVRLDR